MKIIFRRMEKSNKYTKKQILNHLKSKKPLEELYNPNGIEISGGIPHDFGDEITVEPSNSTDKEETQAMNQQDKFGMFTGYNTLIRRESRNKLDSIITEELNKFKINEDISDSSFNSLLKKITEIANKLNVGENKATVEIQNDENLNNKGILVHYTTKLPDSSFQNGTSDEEIQKFINLITINIYKQFLPFKDFFNKGFEGVKDIFSKNLKTVYVSASGNLRRVKAFNNNPDNIRSYPTFNVVQYSNDIDLHSSMHNNKISVISPENEYTTDDLNLLSIYIYIGPKEHFNESKINETNILDTSVTEESSIQKIQKERPDIFLKIEMFINNINSYEITEEDKGLISEYIKQKIK